MENYRSFGGKIIIFWFSLGIFLLLLSYAKAEYKSDPLKNVNLSPFWQWRSAYDCMLNTSDRCSSKYNLTLDGVVNVSTSELQEYCKKGGCAEHTKDVLQCIYYAKRDFWFANKAPVQYINDSISKGCSNNSAINTGDYKSSAMKTYQKLFMSLVSSLATGLTIAIFSI